MATRPGRPRILAPQLALVRPLVVTAVAGSVMLAGFTWTSLINVAVRAAQDPAAILKAQQEAAGTNKEKSQAKPKGGLRAPFGALPKMADAPVNDPLAAAARKRVDAPAAKGEAMAPVNSVTFQRFKLRLTARDGFPLAATYYQSKQGGTAPIVILLHEKGQSSRDFESPIDELKGIGLASALQRQGYAVLTYDLRGHGGSRGGNRGGIGGDGKTQNPTREREPASARAKAAIASTSSARNWDTMLSDLQVAYSFLLDRHNRSELNISKLAVVGLGESANLAAGWTASPGGGVANAGRSSDIAALALVSPLDRVDNLAFSSTVRPIASRLPIYLAAGKDDPTSGPLVEAARETVTRTPQGKVEQFPTTLRGGRLIRVEPNVPSALLKFLDATIKDKTTPWEPRYNLNPTPIEVLEVIKETLKPDELEKGGEKPRSATQPPEPEKAKNQANPPEPPPAPAADKANTNTNTNTKTKTKSKAKPQRKQP